MQHAIEFNTGDALQCPVPAAVGLMLLNPPCGERIEAKGVARRAGRAHRGGQGCSRDGFESSRRREGRESFEAGGSSAEFFSGLAAHWERHYPGWIAWLLSPEMKLPSLMRLK